MIDALVRGAAVAAAATWVKHHYSPQSKPIYTETIGDTTLTVIRPEE